MNNIIGEFLRPVEASWDQMLLALLLAYVLGQIAGWTYMYTHSGLSYSRTFVQAIVLLAVVVAASIMVIGQNLIAAFGLIGALAVIRFRNILKDTRDTAFLFFALVIGMASGTGLVSLALISTAVFCTLVFVLAWSQFGSRYTGDGVLRFLVTRDASSPEQVQELLRRHAQKPRVLSERVLEHDVYEMTYNLYLRDPDGAPQLVRELQDLAGISNVTFFVQDQENEL